MSDITAAWLGSAGIAEDTIVNSCSCRLGKQSRPGEMETQSKDQKYLCPAADPALMLDTKRPIEAREHRVQRPCYTSTLHPVNHPSQSRTLGRIRACRRWRTLLMRDAYMRTLRWAWSQGQPLRVQRAHECALSVKDARFSRSCIAQAAACRPLRRRPAYAVLLIQHEFQS